MQSGRPDSNRRRPAWEILIQTGQNSRKDFSTNILRKTLPLASTVVRLREIAGNQRSVRSFLRSPP